MSGDSSGGRGDPGKQSAPGRFDATIHPRRGAKDLPRLDDVPLDRIPDRYGRLRALLTAEECADLLDMGYEVRLRRHHPIKALDPELIATVGISANFSPFSRRGSRRRGICLSFVGSWTHCSLDLRHPRRTSHRKTFGPNVAGRSERVQRRLSNQTTIPGALSAGGLP